MRGGTAIRSAMLHTVQCYLRPFNYSSQLSLSQVDRPSPSFFYFNAITSGPARATDPRKSFPGSIPASCNRPCLRDLRVLRAPHVLHCGPHVLRHGRRVARHAPGLGHGHGLAMWVVAASVSPCYLSLGFGRVETGGTGSWRFVEEACSSLDRQARGRACTTPLSPNRRLALTLATSLHSRPRPQSRDRREPEPSAAGATPTSERHF